MLTREVLEYIRQQLKAGVVKDEIEKSLIAVGWSMQDMHDAFFSIEQSSPTPPPAQPAAPPFVVTQAQPGVVPSLTIPPQQTPAVQPFVTPLVTPVIASGSNFIPNRSATLQAQPAVESVSQVATNVASTPQQHAGFWLRLAALMTDGYIYAIIEIPFIVFLRSNPPPSDTVIMSIYAGLLIFFIAYPLFMVTKYQATLGKMAFGLRIQRINGDRIGFGRVFLREIVGKIISALILNIGYFMAGFRGDKRALHDLMADTVVIDTNPQKAKTFWILLAVFGVVIFGAIGVVVSIGLARYAALMNLNASNQDSSTTTSTDLLPIATSTSPQSVAGNAIQTPSNGITFTFSPQSGTLPLSIQANCSINTTQKVTEMGIYIDDFLTLAPNETLAEKFLAINTDTRNGVNHSIGGSGTLPRNQYWIGAHKTYCEARINNAIQPLISAPININFQ